MTERQYDLLMKIGSVVMIWLIYAIAWGVLLTIGVEPEPKNVGHTLVIFCILSVIIFKL